MNISLATVVLAALAGLANATAQAQTTAVTCSQASVQVAIDSAPSGSSVAVPAGACTWNAAVTIANKAIVLQGAGSTDSGTVITYGGSGHTLVSIDAGAQSGRTEVAGFKFVGANPDYWSGMHIRFSGPDQWRNLRIHHNTFVGGRNVVVRGGTNVEGLIDHNTFQGSSHSILFDGAGDADWSSPVEYGGPGFFFVESNAFDNLDTYGSTGWLAVDSTNGGKVVFRHNTLRNAFWENHDRCRNGLPSSRAFEVYSNSFTKDGNGWKAVDFASGDGVIFDNTFSASWNIAIGAYESREGQCSLPANEVPGAIDPIYTWGNTRQSGASADTIVCTSSAAACAKMTFAPPGTQKPGYAPYVYPHPLVTSVEPPPPPPTHPPPSGPESLWGSSLTGPRHQDGSRWQLGTVFTATRPGVITHWRVYSAGESGQHTAALFDNTTGSRVRNRLWTYSGTGWRTVAISRPLRVVVGRAYTVTVTTGADSGRRYAGIPGALAAPGGNELSLSYPANAGVFGTNLSARPTQVWQSTNYLRDVVFVAD